MAQAKKTTPKKNTKKTSAGSKSSKTTSQPNINVIFAVMILVSAFIFLCTYIPAACGMLGTAAKGFIIYLFGTPAALLPAALIGLSIYLIFKRDLKKFVIKSLFVFISLILLSALWYVFGQEQIFDLFGGYAPTLSDGGCGILGSLAAKYSVTWFGRIITAVIYIFLIICLASLIFKISFIKLLTGFFESAKEESDEVRKQQSYDAGKRARKAVNSAASSTLRTLKSHSIDFDVSDMNKKSEKEEKTSNPKNDFPDPPAFHDEDEGVLPDNTHNVIDADDIFKNIDLETGEILESEPVEKDITSATHDMRNTVHPIAKAEDPMSQNLNSSSKKRPKREEPLTAEQEQGLRDTLDSNSTCEPIYYEFPPINLLSQSTKKAGDAREELRETANKLVSTLKNFGVDVKLLNVSRGPVVTRYELQPSVGVKVSKITNLADDIALNLAATAVRIEAPIPGKAAIGIEIPNKETSSVTLREVIETPEFKNSSSKLSVAMGKDITGKPVIGDIAKMPHVLIAGATGSGKSVCINSIITSILYKSDPNDVKLILIDPKVVELHVYNGIPHLLIPVVTEPKKASGALGWAVSEMERRYNLFAENGARDLTGYNETLALDGEPTLPQIVIIVDELADLMMTAPKEIEDSICRLAQKARAAGMHLIVATQRPSVNVITGVIKANIPSRIAFAVSSQVDSRTILDGAGAEKLLGKGDMLFMPMGASKPKRLQGAFITDKEVESIVEFIKEKSQAKYDEDITEKINADTQVESDMSDCDELLPKAIEIAIASGSISTSMVQRRLGVGYARAGRIIDQMEARGIISGADGSKPRNVLVSASDLSLPGESMDLPEDTNL